jgi:uncharacterized membrane protein YbhN (UPF0104 family)
VSAAEPKRAWWRLGVMAAGAIGFVAMVRSLPRANWSDLIARVGPVLPVLAGIAVGWMALYARGLRVILDGAVGWGRLIANRIVGDAYNVVAPVGDVGGDPIRIFDLAADVGTAPAVRAIVLDRVVYSTSGLVFSALGSAVSLRMFTWPSRIERLLVAYVVAALMAALVLFLLATSRAIGRATARLLGFVKLRGPELPSPLPVKAFVRALGWHLLGRSGVLLEIALLLVALGQPVRLGALVAISALVSVAGIVFFFVPNGVGVNEGATVFALSLTGYGEGVGLAVGLARRVRQLVMTAAGVALTAVRRRGRGSGLDAVAPQLRGQASGQPEHPHLPVRDEGPERVLEGGRAIVLDEEMAHPGARVDDHQSEEQKLRFALDRRGDDRHGSGVRPEEVEGARQPFAVLAQIERPELVERSDPGARHGTGG